MDVYFVSQSLWSAHTAEPWILPEWFDWFSKLFGSLLNGAASARCQNWPKTLFLSGMKSSACSCAEVSYTDRMESLHKVTRTRHYWQKENKVVLSWSNLDFMDFTRREISFGTITRFIQWICAGISLTGSEWDVCVWGVCGGLCVWGGYMLATDPLFVQKSSMWPPLCRFTVSLAVNSTREHVKQLFVDCHSEVCARARTCGWSSLLPMEKVSISNKVKSPTSGSVFFYLWHQINW